MGSSEDPTNVPCLGDRAVSTRQPRSVPEYLTAYGLACGVRAHARSKAKACRRPAAPKLTLTRPSPGSLRDLKNESDLLRTAAADCAPAVLAACLGQGQP